MSRVRWFLIACCVLLSPAAERAAAGIPISANYAYSVLLDLDNNATTGCSVSVQDAVTAATVSGVEWTVTTEVERSSGSEARVVQVTAAKCTAGSFGVPVEVDPGDWPVGNDTGAGGADVVETFIERNRLGNPVGTARLVFVATRLGASDVLLTTNGQANGGPILFQLLGAAARPVPTMQPGVLAIEILVLVWIGYKASRRFPSAGRTAVMIALVAMASLVIAQGVVITMDGNTKDWLTPPLATDALDDSSVSDPSEDIVAGFAVASAETLYFRMDLANIIGAGLGQTCSQGSECGSGFCVDGVCCDGKCNAECQSCLAANTGLAEGTCGTVTNQQVDSDSCNVGQVCCGGSCVSLDTDSNHCGTCGTVCTDQGAASCGTTGTCAGGSCAIYDLATICRIAADTCDLNENCAGDGSPCPADAFKPGTTECRPAAGVCDVAESCTGSSAACPTNVFRPNTTSCSSEPTCNPDLCDGSGNCTDVANVSDGTPCKQNGGNMCSGGSCVAGCVQLECVEYQGNWNPDTCSCQCNNPTIHGPRCEYFDCSAPDDLGGEACQIYQQEFDICDSPDQRVFCHQTCGLCAG